MYPASDGKAGVNDPLRPMLAILPDKGVAGVVPEGVLAPEPEFGVFAVNGVNSPNGLWWDMVVG